MSQKNELDYCTPTFRTWWQRLKGFVPLALAYGFLTAAIVAGLTEEKLDNHKDPHRWLEFPPFDRARAMRGIALQNTEAICSLIALFLAAVVFIQLFGRLNDGSIERRTKLLQWFLLIFAAIASFLWAFRPHFYS